MGPVRQNPIQRTVRSVRVCALHCAQLLRTILHKTELIIFPLTLQTITNCSDDVYLRCDMQKSVTDAVSVLCIVIEPCSAIKKFYDGRLTTLVGYKN